MSSRLEQFIHDHRDRFDDDEPGKKVWDNIQRQFDPGKKETVPVIWLSAGRWSVVAAVSVLIAGSVWFFTRTVEPKPGATTASNSQGPASATSGPASTITHPSDPIAQSPSNTAGGTKQSSAIAATRGPAVSTQDAHPATAQNKSAADNTEDPTADYQEEMYHYARLVELKHKELRSIEKDEPLLYRQFTGDVKKLDSVYQSLGKQLPRNPNREQLLEAMLQNLQLQMELLNHQLHIIKKINHSKKTAYDDAYKTT
jgi:hypothetical protein